MTTHTTPPLAQQLRSLAASAPTLHRPHLAAAADQVEENARLRAERDEARATLTAMTVWLEREAPEVFRRGLWEAIDAALRGDESDVSRRAIGLRSGSV